MELYNLDEFANHHGSKRAVPETQIKDKVIVSTIFIIYTIYIINIIKLRNADLLIQQETIRTNFVSSHHHCLIFIKYM